MLIENQYVAHWAVRLQEGENPPVYLRYNEGGEAWALRARSFSDWIGAFAWDYRTIEFERGWRFLKTAEEQANFQLSDFEVSGPETFLVSADFKADRFLRVMQAGQRLTVIFPETSP